MREEELKTFINWLYANGYVIADEDDLLDLEGALLLASLFIIQRRMGG